MVLWLICTSRSFWLSPLGLVKCLAFIFSNVDIKDEVSISGERVSVYCRHSNLPAGSVPAFVFVRICHGRDLPKCCLITSLPGLSQARNVLTKWVLFCYDTLYIRIQVRLWHDADWCSASFCVSAGEPRMPTSIALGQPRLKAVLDIPDFLHGTGNLASLGFLIPQPGPRKC